jgi:peptide subunit release factor 1 (eRF1)
MPHLYPLARLNDQYPRYAALLVDTNSARLFVVGLGSAQHLRTLDSDKTKKHAMGGWSQARYQRNVDNFREQHIKEVVDLLDRVVRDEHLDRIVISCHEVAQPLLFDAMPKHLSDKVIDLVRLDINAPEREVLTATLDALRHHDVVTDAEHVDMLLDAWRAGGLGVVGAEETLRALEMGQVEELLITATPDALAGAAGSRDELANRLVTKAQQTAARIRFIEDAALLGGVGGCGALLRFKV